MNSRFIYIILAIVIVLLVNPFIRPLGPGGHLLSTVLVAMIPLASIYALTQERRAAIIILLLAAPYVILDGFSPYSTYRYLPTIALGLGTILYCYIVIVLISKLLSFRIVTANLIYCAVSIYLLIGMTWAGVYGVLEGTAPGTFAGLSSAREDLVYFSFVTLTTVGYGDITPVSILGGRLAVVEAAMGSIYMAVIIAMIVGRYMSLQADSERQE